MRISIDTREPDSRMIMLEPTNLTNAIYTVHKWKICSLEFSSTSYLCAHVPMHVPLRRKAILQCHKFEAKLISNLKVASMSAHINYLVLFFCFLVFFLDLTAKSE